jgi:hypothetical protein
MTTKKNKSTVRGARKGAKSKAPSSRESFWSHPYWALLLSQGAERRGLQLFAIDSVRSAEEYFDALGHLARAVRKYDPEYRHAGSAEVEEILSAARCSYRPGSSSRAADPKLRKKLHSAARGVLLGSSSPIAARTLERTGANIRAQKDWGRRLVAHLTQVARLKLKGSALSMAVTSDLSLWRNTPEKFRHVKVGGCPCDLRDLDWERLPADPQSNKLEQPPLTAALDKWCAKTVLEKDPEKRAVDLLAALGVDYKAAHNAINASENMSAQRRATRK